MTVPTILLVEDNPGDQALTLRAFKQSGIANPVVLAQDGAEALDYLFCRGDWQEREPVNPALILLDLNLPKIGGVEVLRRIRADTRTRSNLVVILTSSIEERDVGGSYGAGTNSYVQKPVEFTEFAKVVGDLGLYWMLLNKPPPIP